jgi:hypothetical protein
MRSLQTSHFNEALCDSSIAFRLPRALSRVEKLLSWFPVYPELDLPALKAAFVR